MRCLAPLLLSSLPLLHAAEPLRIAPFKADTMPTILSLFGLEHHKLSHRFQGLDRRLTGVNLAKALVAWPQQAIKALLLD